MRNEDVVKPWILIVTHGKFGEELKRSAEMIMGQMQDIYCFSLLEEMDPLELKNQINEVLNDAPGGSIIFTDIFGGTPSNIAATFSKNHYAVSGVNLPMIVEAEMSRTQMEISDLMQKIIHSASDGIRNITKIMNERERI
ncbi:PTS sugar transporter subunit IIA [Oceanobacillus sp. CFH 90083]|uniref:PTS sugar transporter subunit IIA n=1 Tax=Oceanobacillus sp. CFH 90083 TaxID=2592336 RepID=UPI00128E5E49|nr:PTS sugar transporter subunit IIA [Oceanobacillus sp. CFH 90083]